VAEPLRLDTQDPSPFFFLHSTIQSSENTEAISHHSLYTFLLSPPYILCVYLYTHQRCVCCVCTDRRRGVKCALPFCVSKRRPVSDIGGHLPLVFFYQKWFSILLFGHFLTPFHLSILAFHSDKSQYNLGPWGTFKLCTHTFPLARRD
jgi:hypothetical protein